MRRGEVVITCEACGSWRAFPADYLMMAGESLEIILTMLGWTINEGSDLCPKCKAVGR
jgi:hypothetical protein